MKRFALPGLACALAVSASGCGPTIAPIPLRPDAETQKKVDGGWENMLAPVGRLTHAEMLDVLVGAQIYQYGVDTFELKAVKRYTGGKVVMEARCDREHPETDRFTVVVYDLVGTEVRRETYTRDEVEKTYNDLYTTYMTMPAGQVEPADRKAAREAKEARLTKVFDLFPKEAKPDRFPKDDPAVAPAPR